MSFRNEVDIRMINDTWESGGYFTELWEDNWYVVIDKQRFGEKVGEVIKNKKYEEGNLKLYNTDKVDILNEVEKTTNKIRNEIIEFVIEYLEENKIECDN